MSIKLFIEPIEDKKWLELILDNMPHTITSVNECDYIFSTKIQMGCMDVQVIENALRSYKDIQKKVLVFLISDYNDIIEFPNNIILFRTGLYKSKRKQNEYILPYIWCLNELKTPHDLPVLPKRTIKPTIGFCGYISSHPSRPHQINKIKMSPDIKSNFILRTEFWGGNPFNQSIINDFVKNIKDNHFTLCCRGTGNWSIRFYQVLYLRRIPVVVNTDLLLPFEEKINWKEIIVFPDNENDLPNSIKFFWATKDIEQAQHRCKEIYEQYFTPEMWCKIITNEILIPLKEKNECK